MGSVDRDAATVLLFFDMVFASSVTSCLDS